MSEPSSTSRSSTSEVVTIVVSDEQTDVDIDAHRWAELAGAVLQAEGVSGELTLTFVDRDEIAALNAEHMGERGPTDVLSFPLDSVDDSAGALPGPVLLGDVVVCPAVASEAAQAHAGTLDDQLALLVVHGVLHVLGHDHAQPNETRLMRQRERALLEQHHWHGPGPDPFTREQRS
jgi:probable rRNA maturation factor